MWELKFNHVQGRIIGEQALLRLIIKAHGGNVHWALEQCTSSGSDDQEGE
jgi:hypothetical protein